MERLRGKLKGSVAQTVVQRISQKAIVARWLARPMARRRLIASIMVTAFMAGWALAACQARELEVDRG